MSFSANLRHARWAIALSAAFAAAGTAQDAGTDAGDAYAILRSTPQVLYGARATYTGYAVAGAGDVNGDGHADVLVAATPDGSVQGERELASLYLGSPSGLVSAPAWRGAGRALLHEINAVAGAGDVNGDGYDDVLVSGAYYLSPGTRNLVLLFHGSSLGLQATPSLTLTEVQNLSGYGHSVAGAGDVNGDGYDDVIIGAFVFGNDHPHEGAAYLHLGGAAGLSGEPSWTYTSGQESARFGVSVSSAGDVNADGYADVIVGADYYYDVTSDGRAFVFLGGRDGLHRTPDWIVKAGRRYSDFARVVSGAGDVNNDGFDDVLVSEPGCSLPDESEGCVHLFLGGEGGLATSAAWSVQGNHETDWLGTSICGVGDVNGDGFDDVGVGAFLSRSWQAPGLDFGKLELYIGGASALGLEPAFRRETEQEAAPRAVYGRSCAGAGDVDGDGFDDIVAGRNLAGSEQQGSVSAFFGTGPSCAGRKAVPCPVDTCQVARCDVRVGCVTSLASPGVSCRAARCEDGRALKAASCDGIHPSCPAMESESCGTYACQAGACLHACQGDQDCAAGAGCEQATCRVRPLDAGAPLDAGLDAGSLVPDAGASNDADTHAPSADEDAAAADLPPDAAVATNEPEASVDDAETTLREDEQTTLPATPSDQDASVSPDSPPPGLRKGGSCQAAPVWPRRTPGSYSWLLLLLILSIRFRRGARELDGSTRASRAVTRSPS